MSKRCIGAPYIPLATRIMLYNALILPRYDYCGTVWGCTSQQNLTRLQRLQSRAMRVILNAPPRTHIEDMLSKLRWMSVRQRLEYNRLVLMWKIFHGYSPRYLSDKLVLVKDRHRTTSATRNNIYVPRGHRYSLFTGTATSWNALPADMRNIDNLKTFKSHLIKHLLKNCAMF